ncbi:MAG: exo-alpha-sialidase [Clostridia bacterium]|nr:exo-alpha-sialidase [Clostridia bacterium]
MSRLITFAEELAAYRASLRLWQGIPSIEITRGGRIFLSAYSGGFMEQIGNFSFLLFSDDGGKTFSDPPAAVAVVDGGRSYDPCLWIDPLGRLWFTWAQCPDDGLYAVICEEPDAEQLTFSEPFLVGHNVMMNKPTVCRDGAWLFPIAVWNHGIRVLGSEFDDPDPEKGSFAWRTMDRGKSFVRLGGADVKDRHFDEHMFLELSNGTLRCYVRTFYGIGAADSTDGGLTWGQDFDTGLGGPDSRFHIRRLSSGRILLINHYNFKGRNNLTAMLSEDDGKTFPYRLLLDGRDSVSYPDAAVTENGRIHIVYDRERGAFMPDLEAAKACAREILLASITEEDILAGVLQSPDSYLARVACKLSEFEGKDPFSR